MSRGHKFHSSAPNYEWNLERTSNLMLSPVGWVLWEGFFEGEDEKHRVKLAFSEYWLWNFVVSKWDAVMNIIFAVI